MSAPARIGRACKAAGFATVRVLALASALVLCIHVQSSAWSSPPPDDAAAAEGAAVEGAGAAAQAPVKKPPASSEPAGRRLRPEDLLRRTIQAQLQLLEQRGFQDVVIEPYDHRAFGEAVLLVTFRPKEARPEPEAQQMLSALVPSLSDTTIRFVAFVDVERGRGRASPPPFDVAFWRIARDRWVAIGDDPYGYFESRLAATPAAGENALRRAQYQLRMGLIDRAGSRWARARALLRSALAEIAGVPGGARVEVAILEALLGDAVMNRDDPLNSDAEPQHWYERYIAAKRALNERIGTGPVYIEARRFRDCGNNYTKVEFDVLPDGRVANVVALDTVASNPMSAVCKRELTASVARWRYAPHPGPTPEHRSESFKSVGFRRGTLRQ